MFKLGFCGAGLKRITMWPTHWLAGTKHHAFPTQAAAGRPRALERAESVALRWSDHDQQRQDGAGTMGPGKAELKCGATLIDVA